MRCAFDQVTVKRQPRRQRGLQSRAMNSAHLQVVVVLAYRHLRRPSLAHRISLPDSRRILSRWRVLGSDGSSVAFLFMVADLPVSWHTVASTSFKFTAHWRHCNCWCLKLVFYRPDVSVWDSVELSRSDTAVFLLGVRWHSNVLQFVTTVSLCKFMSSHLYCQWCVCHPLPTFLADFHWATLVLPCGALVHLVWLFAMATSPNDRTSWEYADAYALFDMLSSQFLQRYVVTWGMLNAVPTWATLLLQVTGFLLALASRQVGTFGIGHWVLWWSALHVHVTDCCFGLRTVVIRFGTCSWTRCMDSTICACHKLVVAHGIGELFHSSRDTFGRRFARHRSDIDQEVCVCVSVKPHKCRCELRLGLLQLMFASKVCPHQWDSLVFQLDACSAMRSPGCKRRITAVSECVNTYGVRARGFLVRLVLPPRPSQQDSLPSCQSFSQVCHLRLMLLCLGGLARLEVVRDSTDISCHTMEGPTHANADVLTWVMLRVQKLSSSWACQFAAQVLLKRLAEWRICTRSFHWHYCSFVHMYMSVCQYVYLYLSFCIYLYVSI